MGSGRHPVVSVAPPRAASVVVEAAGAAGQARCYRLVMKKVFCLGSISGFQNRGEGCQPETF